MVGVNKLYVGIAAGLLAACQPSEPASPGQPPTVTVPSAQAGGETRRAAPRASNHCFVGQLGANEKMDHVRPADFCVDGQHYVGAAYRLSRLNLFGVDALPSEWLGEYVMVSAVRRANLASRLEPTGPCPAGEPFPIQARDDWAPEEGSYLTTTERLSQADYLEVTGEPRLLSLLSVQRPPPEKRGRKRGASPSDPSAEVVALLSNPLDEPLEALRVVFHYEGGPGKPMPHYDSVPVRRLLPGRKTTLRRPASIERPTRGGETAWWHFESVALEGRAGGCEMLPSTYRR